MSNVKNLGIVVDNDTKKIHVELEVGGTTVSHFLDDSEAIYNELYNKALVQYEGYLRDQIESLSSITEEEANELLN